MRNTYTKAALSIAAALLLLTANMSFATPNADPDPSQSSQTIQNGQEAKDGDVTVVMHLVDSPGQPTNTDTATQQAPASEEDSFCRIRRIATTYLGTPYKWGGVTPAAFDCSGFTRYVYSSMGVHIPRTAREQYKAGTPVKYDELQTGDLVFFDMAKGYVSHVGLYLGDGRFIHASTPATGVKISNLNDRSYKRHFVGARRYNIA